MRRANARFNKWQAEIIDTRRGCAAWLRRLYYDVYGLIRDILEMSRVHAVAYTPPGNAGKVVEWSRGRKAEEVRGGCEDRRAVARGEWVTAVTCPDTLLPPSATAVPPCRRQLRVYRSWFYQLGQCCSPTYSPCFQAIRKIAVVTQKHGGVRKLTRRASSRYYFRF